MVWQDFVISGAQLVAVFSLIPSIISDDKPALATSLMSFAIMMVIASCMLSLGMWFSCLTGYSIALAWLILVVQKYRADKNKTK